MTNDFSEFITDRTKDFTGREWLFSEVDKWLANDRGSRAFLLIGAPGTGKSSILARLAQLSLGQATVDGCPRLAPGFLAYYHFCQAQHDTTLNPTRFVEALSLALARRHQAFAKALLEIKQGETQITINATQTVTTASDGSQVQNVVIENLSTGNLSARVTFDRIIRLPLESLCTKDFKETIVVLIDSLDEARTWREEENIVTLLSETMDDPRDLPVQVRFLLSCRPDDRVLQAIGVTPSLDLITDAPKNAREVYVYVSLRLANAPLAAGLRDNLADRLAKTSAGNFLYARYVLDDWLARPTELTAESALDLPAGLFEIYRRFLKRELARDQEKWEGRYQLLFGLLAVARSDGLLPATLAGASSKPPREVDNALRACAQYLAGPQPGGPFRIYHQSFRDFLLEDTTYSVYPAEAHQALADFFIGEYAKAWYTCRDEYALRYSAAHLIEALEAVKLRVPRQQLADLLASLLTNFGLLDARVRRGWVYELAGDFSHALRLLTEDHPQRAVLDRLSELLRSEAQFITSHPSSFFQSFWNRGWWFDSQDAASFYQPPPGGWQAGQAPWERPGEKLHRLLEHWREQRAKTGTSSIWLRALRPPPDPLGSAQLAVFLEQGDESFKIAISPDQRRFVSGGGEDWGMVKLYDLAGSGEQLASIGFEKGEFVIALAYSPRGDVIAVALGDDSLRLLDPQRLEEIGRLPQGDSSPRLPSGIGALVFSPDGRLLVTGHDNGELIAWDMDTRRKLASVQGHQAQVQSLAFAANGSELVSGGSEEWRRWRLDQHFRPVHTRSFNDDIVSLAYSPDGRLLACAPYCRDVVVCDLDGKDVCKFQVGEDEHAECLAFTPDGRSLLAGAGDVFSAANVYCWDLRSARLKWKLPGHNFLVEQLMVFHDGKFLLTAGDNTIRLWDLDRVAGGYMLNSIEPDIDHAVFSPDGVLVFTASEKYPTVYARQVRNGHLMQQWHGHDGGVFCLAVAPDGRQLACGCGSGAVRVWDVDRGAEQVTFTGGELAVEALAFSPDGHLLAIGSQDETVRLVSMDTHEEVGILTQGSWVKHVSFSSDGRLLLTGDFDHLIVWDVGAQKKLSQFRKDIKFYDSACFTDDSRFAVVESSDKLIAWDVATGAPVPVGDAHKQALDRVKMRRPSPYILESPTGLSDVGGAAAPRPELVLRRAESDEPIAWLPTPYGGILDHPDGDVWGVRRGGYLYLYALETA